MTGFFLFFGCISAIQCKESALGLRGFLTHCNFGKKCQMDCCICTARQACNYLASTLIQVSAVSCTKPVGQAGVYSVHKRPAFQRRESSGIHHQTRKSRIFMRHAFWVTNWKNILSIFARPGESSGRIFSPVSFED